MALNNYLVKPEKIVATGVGLLDQEMVLPNLVHREGVDEYRGAADDTVNVVVEGLLPFHKFEWRSGEQNTDGTQYAGGTPSATVRDKLVFDRYTERKVPITFGGNVYSAVEMTDEQKDFDFTTWTDKILSKQVRAIGRGLNHMVADELINAPFEVTVGAAEGRERAAIFEARRVLNRFQVPGNRILVVGTDFEAALLSNKDITFALNAGDAQADSALHEATLGRLAGFQVVVALDLPSTMAIAMVDSGVALATAAPSVPQSVVHGATQSFNGYAMRWLTDYSADYLVDRSVVNTYAGCRYIQDNLIGWNDAAGSEIVSANQHYVRAIKLDLSAASVYPGATDELNTITGVGSAEGAAYAAAAPSTTTA